MKNRPLHVCKCAFFAFFLLISSILQAQTYNGQGSLFIPNIGNCNPVTGLLESVASVPLTGAIGEDYALKRVQLSIQHANVQQLVISLEAPDGTIWELSSNNGLSGANYTNTIFADNNPTIVGAQAPFSTSYRAEQGPFNGPAGGFDGVAVNGDWKLVVCDQTTPTAGILLSWSITFECAVKGAFVLTQNASCQQSNGAATLHLPPGAATTNIAWSTGQSNVTAISGLASGAYSVTVENGTCSVVKDFSIGFSEEPVIEWENNFGSNLIEVARSVQQMPDGGYILTGENNPLVGSQWNNNGQGNFWVVRTDAAGNLVWQNTFGGPNNDLSYSVWPTANGGSYLGGFTCPTASWVSCNFWIMKLNAAGNIIWQDTYGGSEFETVASLQETSDGNLVAAGYSFSNDGDLPNTHGQTNFWIIKVNGTNGNLIWSKVYGGSGSDQATSVKETPDGGFIVAGGSTSNGGNVGGNYGDQDFWVIKLDFNGNLVWQQNYGGSAEDWAYGVDLTPDGGYYITGETSSGNFDVTDPNGGVDFWVIKVDAMGNLVWQRSLGGTADDKSFGIQTTSDGGCIATGYSTSNDIDVGANYGLGDFWVVKLDTAGNIQWEKNLGGASNDYGNAIIQASDGGYVVAGQSQSSDIDVGGNNGLIDFWVVKLGPPPPPSIVPSVVIDPQDPDICEGESVLLQAQATSCAGCVYSWSNGPATPNQTVSPPSTTAYSVMVTNNSGCSDTDTTVVNVYPNAASSFSDTICLGQTYTWNGQDYTSAGDYTQTLQTIHNCDSVVTLTLVVIASYNISISDSFCEGDSYDWNGTVYTAGGSYVQSFLTPAGCDSIVTLTLTELPSPQTAFSDTYCEGDTYDWNGTIYDMPGTYTQTFPAFNGCDSTVTLTLDELDSPQTAFSDSYCEGEPYDWNGQTYDMPGDYTQTFPASNGCDSTVTLTLMELPNASFSFSEIICEGEFFEWNGVQYDQTGSYEDTFTAFNGCDSVVTFDLTVLPVFQTAFSETICEGDTYDWNGQAYDMTGTYTQGFIASNGCDSTVTLDLTVLPSPQTAFSDTYCEGDTYDWNGTIYDMPGTYTQTFPAFNGCDSTVTLTLDELPSPQTAFSDSYCEGEPYDWNGTTYDMPGDYTQTFPAFNGCDSTVTLTLMELPNASFSFSEIICEGEFFEWNGVQYDQTGSYEDTFTAFNGCDSVVTFDLTVLPVFQTAFSETICEGDTYDWNGQTYDMTGTYTQGFIASNGCDSTVTLDLTVLPSPQTAFSDTYCEGDIYDWNGTIYDMPGDYTQTFPAFNGCDSTVTLTLDELPSPQTAFSDSYCEGDTYDWNGQTYDMPGDYTQTFPASNGCDSTVTLTLTEHPVEATAFSASFCQGGSYVWNGVVYDMPGDYTQNFATVNGCDSTVTLTLTEVPGFIIDIADAFCEGDSYDWNGTIYTAAGTYTQNFVTSQGCDSTVNLTLTELPDVTTAFTDTFCEGGSYTWNSETYTAAGSYVQAFTTVDGCDSTVTLTLEELPNATSAFTDSYCQGDTYDWNGQTYDMPGDYTQSFTAFNGCDSTVTLTLEELPNATSAFSDSYCAGGSYDWNGQLYDMPGDYTQSFTAFNGCDSTVTLTLVELPNAASAFMDTYCEGGSYDWNGQLYDMPGDYTQSFPAFNGCDSTVMLTLVELPNAASAFSDTYCEGDFYEWNGEEYDQPGTYTQSFTASNACDSTVTLTLTELPDATFSFTENICEGEEYVWNGQVYTQAGTYPQSFTAFNGCDSTAFLTLVVLPVAESSFSDSFCEDDTYFWNGNGYNAGGTYTQTFPAFNGCDSIVTLTLTELPNAAGAFSDSFCEGETYSWNGVAYNAGGTYTQSFTAFNGCDSVTILTLTELPNAAGAFSDSFCQGDTYAWNGATYSAGGTYIQTLQAFNGCDSVVTLTLAELPNATGAFSDSFCAGDSYTWNGITYNQPGTHIQTLQAFNGCDSVVTLTLTELQHAFSAFEDVLCEGSTYEWNGNIYSTAGSYSQVFTAFNGCDSTVTLTLILEGPSTLGAANAGPDAVICQEDYTLEGTLPGGVTGLWTTGTTALILDPDDPESMVTDLEGGSNLFTWTLSSANCPDYDSDEVNIQVVTSSPDAQDDFYEGDFPNLTFTGNVLDNDGYVASLGPVVTLVSGPPAGNLTLNPDGSFVYEAPGAFAQLSFTYALSYTDCPGLSAEAVVQLTLNSLSGDIDGFTPNGDGLNDFFIVPELVGNMAQFQRRELIVFNRWGDVVYQAQPYNNDWDGTYLGEGTEPLPAATYYYVLWLDLPDDGVKEGALVIIR